MVELVLGRLSPKLDAVKKEADERHSQLLAENTSFKAEHMRKDAQIEQLINENAASNRSWNSWR